MAVSLMLDRAFQIIMRRMVETGQAPHYTEVAAVLGCGVEAGRQLLHQVIDAFVPSWFFPETDYVASFPPFSNLPTQYRISVAGQQKWFAQCGFESLAVTWLFPGQLVRIDAPCLDCGQPITLEMQDGQFVRVEPPGILGHLNQPWIVSKPRLPLVCSNMNLFRSGDHVRRWAHFNPASEEGMMPLPDLAKLFGTPSRRQLLDEHYLSVWYPRRYEERRSVLEGLGKATPFWLGEV